MKTLISDMLNTATESSYTPTATAPETPNAIDGAFIFAGKAVFTVEPTEKYVLANNCKPHYTFQITKKEGEYQGKPQTTYFAALLTGPDNESDYTYLGILNTSGNLKLTKASRYPAESVPVSILERVITALVNGRGEQITNAGWKVHHEGRCGRCGRTLTVPESVEYGIGPECRKKM